MLFDIIAILKSKLKKTKIVINKILALALNELIAFNKYKCIILSNLNNNLKSKIKKKIAKKNCAFAIKINKKTPISLKF